MISVVSHLDVFDKYKIHLIFCPSTTDWTDEDDRDGSGHGSSDEGPSDEEKESLLWTNAEILLQRNNILWPDNWCY